MLEDATDKNIPVFIMCTQPRRLATVELAERVANERGEACPSTVGYRIKGKKKTTDNTCLTFCTAGWLLQRLALDPSFLEKVTHLILDDAHEREGETDFLLGILRKKLRERKHRHLRLILMSAKMNVSVFASFFIGSAELEIEGKCHPVDVSFMEQILKNPSVFPEYQDRPFDEALKYYYRLHQTGLDFDMTRRILSSIPEKDPGAVLVFLPGYKEIMDVHKLICNDPNYEVMFSYFLKILAKFQFNVMFSSFQVYKLYSKMDVLDQRLVMRPPSDGKRKVVLSTNIAETSITIEDVVYVIDYGMIAFLLSTLIFSFF